MNLVSHMMMLMFVVQTIFARNFSSTFFHCADLEGNPCLLPLTVAIDLAVLAHVRGVESLPFWSAICFC